MFAIVAVGVRGQREVDNWAWKNRGIAGAEREKFSVGAVELGTELAEPCFSIPRLRCSQVSQNGT